jgi:NADPH:quinone reductase-like Zn-dependent oxidoreductase
MSGEAARRTGVSRGQTGYTVQVPDGRQDWHGISGRAAAAVQRQAGAEARSHALGRDVLQQEGGPMSLTGKTVFISGASRGVGLAIAIRTARDGANVALIAKTAEPHPKLEGTVYTAAEQIQEAGGHALPVVGDIRDEPQVAQAVAQAVERSTGSTYASTTPRRSTCPAPRRWRSSATT